MATELTRFALEKTMDRELLELAAKAAGHSIVWGDKWNVGGDLIDCTDMAYIRSGQPDEGDVYWNPLDDDGDALRLAVKLNIDLRFYPDSEITEPWVEAAADGGDADEALSPDPYAATRRAIVRAAAEIGRTM